MPCTATGSEHLRTPFYQFHLDHQAKMVNFAGWDMPIMYTSIHEEHHRVRTEAGLFDISHMGRLKISGRDARRLLERILTRRVSDMPQGTCRYSLICNEQGGVLDDIIVYRFEYDWLLVVNACNRKKILTILRQLLKIWPLRLSMKLHQQPWWLYKGPRSWSKSDGSQKRFQRSNGTDSA